MLFPMLDQYACMLLAMFMCLGLSFVCHAMCYCSLFVPFIVFSCVLAYWFGPDLDPMAFVIIHTRRRTSKSLDNSYLHVYAYFLLYFMLVLTSLLYFAMLDLVWLHLTPMRPCLGVTTWGASPNARLLRAYPSLFCSMRWYVCHACLCHLLAFYASLHACLHVHAWVLLTSVSSILQHNEDMDTQSKPTFVPRGHHLLLALLLCLPYLSCLLALYPLHIIYTSLSFQCLSTGFLFLPLHVHTWSKDA